MRQFDPTRPPEGRLARLGVVLDAATADESARIARFCDRAGIDVVWIADRAQLTGDGSADTALSVGSSIAGSLVHSRLGVIASRQATGLSVPDQPAAVHELTMPVRRLSEGQWRDSGPRLGAIVDDLADVGLALGADDIVLPGWVFDDLETAADEVRATALDNGRDPATLGVVALAPVSIGRTRAEAEARAEADPGFAEFGSVRDVGIFGTLEECQDRVIALAHAGISDLRCILPASLDVHDVIAQLTAMTVGTTSVLLPGSLRSPAPAPPAGWGGRPDRPPGDRISGGSRRR